MSQREILYIHQIYGLFDDNISLTDNKLFTDSYLKYSFICSENNYNKKRKYNYEYKLWNKESCEELLLKYPEFKYYHDVRFKIMKVDIMRFIILYHYGGLYSDMDIIPQINNFDFVLDNPQKMHLSEYVNKKCLGYDIEVIGCYRKNPLLYEYLKYMPTQIEEKNNIDVYKSWKIRYVFQTTGPRSFNRFLKNTSCPYDIISLNTVLFEEGITGDHIPEWINEFYQIKFFSFHSLSYMSHNKKNKTKYINKKEKKIVVVSWYNDKIKDYADKFSLVNKEYCKYNKYDFIVSNKQYVKTDRAPAYNKLPFILDTLNSTEYDYVVWIDADAHFRKMDRLENYISNGEDIIWSADQPTNVCNINTGFMILKNTDYTKYFLNEWINIKVKNPYPQWWEQGFMFYIWENNLFEIKSHSKVIPFNILQNFKKDDTQPLIYHMAGRKHHARVNYINSKIKEKNKIYIIS